MRDWRAQISRRLLAGMAISSCVLMVAFANTLTPWSFSFGLLATAAIGGLALWREAPGGLRAAVTFVAMGYAAVLSLYSGQDVGAGIIYLVTAVVLAVVLVDWRVALGLLAGAAGLVGVAAWSIHAGVPILDSTGVQLERWAMLVGNAVNLILLGSVIVASLAFMMKRLREALSHQADALAELERESAEREAALELLEEAHARLQETQDQLVNAGKMELLGQLAGGIAHDMNNALTVVLGEAGLLHEQAPEEAEAISDAVEHASNLTRQLLAMGRRQVVQPRPIELGACVERACAMLRRTLPSDIRIELSLPTRVAVRADPSQIQQIVLNLGTNASHAMPEGGELRVRLRLEGERAHLEIADSGVGMDVATQARIFEPFFTTKAIGVGTGLGLASVRSVVEALGGLIACESRLGAGTCFDIELPALALGSLAGAEAVDGGGPSERLDGLRILVVDDQVRVRAVVTTTLQSAGAHVTDAGHADAAIALARQAAEPFDLLWTDVVMSQGSGGSLVAWFVEHSPSTKILVCTGYSDDEVLRRDVALGRYSLLTKPFSRAACMRACAAALADEARTAESA